jgi:hypothetical protein
MSKVTSETPMSFVNDGRRCIGFLLNRGRSGVEAFDIDTRSLGVFASAKVAADAVSAAATVEAELDGESGR